MTQSIPTTNSNSTLQDLIAGVDAMKDEYFKPMKDGYNETLATIGERNPALKELGTTATTAYSAGSGYLENLNIDLFDFFTNLPTNLKSFLLHILSHQITYLSIIAIFLILNYFYFNLKIDEGKEENFFLLHRVANLIILSYFLLFLVCVPADIEQFIFTEKNNMIYQLIAIALVNVMQIAYFNKKFVKQIQYQYTNPIQIKK
jgi:hypothetical protein